MGEEDRAGWILRRFPEILQSDVIVDLGCRNSYIKAYLDSDDPFISGAAPKVIGVDRQNGDNVDMCYDLDNIRAISRISDHINSDSVSVLASHVLEHVQHFHQTTKDLANLATDYILIGLPNELNWIRRLQMLFGNLTSKWEVSGSDEDYHRWMFDIDSARSVTTDILGRRQFQLVDSETPMFQLEPTATKFRTRLLQTLIEMFGSEGLRCRDWWGLFESAEHEQKRRQRANTTSRLEDIGYL